MKISIQSFAVFTFTLATFALQPIVQAVVPPPDGGYPGGNTAEGQNALLSLTTGGFNTALGFLSLRSDTDGSFNTAVGAGTLLMNTGENNTAVGAGALLNNTLNGANTAVGTFALLSNTKGSSNTAMGAEALLSNTVGFTNCAFGWRALKSNTTGPANTAVGTIALSSNTDGDNNTAVGSGAMFLNTVGFENTAMGAGALLLNLDGGDNTAMGVQALALNDAGSFNTAIGESALYLNTTGTDNVAVGVQAMSNNDNGIQNTAVGNAALASNTSGINNTAVGFGALPNSTGSGSIGIGSNAGELVGSSNNVIAIGNPGDDVDNTTWIGNIYGVSTQSGTTAQVIVSDSGQLGTVASSERFKKDIATMEDASETILSLRPVTFHYKSDCNETPQFGLIAEEVARVNPALVLPDRDGKPYTVRYDAVNAMLLNEFLKEHRKVEELESAMAQQRKDFEAATVQQQKTTEDLVARLNEQEERIQKVSAQVEMRRSGAQMLVENQ